MDDGFDEIDKRIKYKTGSQKRTFVKDEDLQIQIPSSNDEKSVENAMAFKKIYTHYMSKADNDSEQPIQPQARQAHKEITTEMKDAETAYKSMMEIRKTITDAYQDLMQLK